MFTLEPQTVLGGRPKMTMKSQRDSLELISCKGFCVAVLFVSPYCAACCWGNLSHCCTVRVGMSNPSRDFPAALPILSPLESVGFNWYAESFAHCSFWCLLNWRWQFVHDHLPQPARVRNPLQAANVKHRGWNGSDSWDMLISPWQEGL